MSNLWEPMRSLWKSNRSASLRFFSLAALCSRSLLTLHIKDVYGCIWMRDALSSTFFPTGMLSLRINIHLSGFSLFYTKYVVMSYLFHISSCDLFFNNGRQNNRFVKVSSVFSTGRKDARFGRMISMKHVFISSILCLFVSIGCSFVLLVFAMFRLFQL